MNNTDDSEDEVMRQVRLYHETQLRFYETAFNLWKEPVFVNSVVKGLREMSDEQNETDKKDALN